MAAGGLAPRTEGFHQLRHLVIDKWQEMKI